MVYITSDDTSSEGDSAYVVFFDGEKWTSPVLLTQSNGYLDSLSVIARGDGKFHIYYTKTTAEFS